MNNPITRYQNNRNVCKCRRFSKPESKIPDESCCNCDKCQRKTEVPYQCKQQQSTCCCCKCDSTPKKVKGKFGLAWIMETPDCKREPSGWQVEFFDTPSRVFQKCQDMIDWVNAPPVTCTCPLLDEEDFNECQDGYSSTRGPCCKCCPKQSSGYFNSNKGEAINSEEIPVKDQPKIDRASSAVTIRTPNEEDINQENAEDTQGGVIEKEENQQESIVKEKDNLNNIQANAQSEENVIYNNKNSSSNVSEVILLKSSTEIPHLSQEEIKPSEVNRSPSTATKATEITNSAGNSKISLRRNYRRRS